ncbi:hypothetical protein BGY98DRAFT_68125 [Russula aff. rugulosa BPL654]|nr:hypothetical protein BGY98DRAFT_68125 [Russula aff. rugulosa BPL654]
MADDGDGQENLRRGASQKIGTWAWHTNKHLVSENKKEGNKRNGGEWAFMKTYNCLFIARSCNGLRSTTSQKLQAVLDFQDPSRLRQLVHLHPRLLHQQQRHPVQLALHPHLVGPHGKWGYDRQQAHFLAADSNVMINDQVGITGVVCNLISQGDLYFCSAHGKINMPAEINVLFADNHNVGVVCITVVLGDASTHLVQ